MQLKLLLGRLFLVFALLALPQAPVLAEDAGATGATAPTAPTAAEVPKEAALPVVIDNSQEVSFDTPEAIRDYQLSVGDTIAVNLWASNLRYSQVFTIPFEGRLYLPSLGEIEVNRRTTAQVQRDLVQRLGSKIKGLQASVLLVKTRQISVYVTGLVRQPGIVTVPVLSRLGAALARAGGILPEGSSRRLSLAHAGKKPVILDWYQFQFKGRLDANPRLAAGDVINVPPLGGQATIEGAVFRPGAYEILPGETLGDLIGLAHGLKSDAALGQSSLAHRLNSGASDRRERPLDLAKGSALRTPLQNMDRLFIPTNTLTYIPMPRTKVHIQGEVTREGFYTLTLGQTLRDLFNQAGGPRLDAGLRQVKIFHKALSGGAAGDPSLVINAYSMLFEGDESQNVTLQDGDLVMVPSNKLPVEDSVINVTGQVGKPGRVPFRVGARVSDYLNAAGGPLPRANLGSVSVTRKGSSFKVDAYRIMREGRDEGNIELEAGDIVDVPESFFYVGNFQDVVNMVLAGVAVWAAVKTVTGK